MNKEKPYSYELDDGRIIDVSLEEFRYMTNYSSWGWKTTETITLTIIDYSYEQNVFIANTNLDKVPIFIGHVDYYSGIVAFDPFVDGVIWLEEEDYHNKKIASSCIGHTFTIPTNISHEWSKYKGKDIILYYPVYDDIIDTSWEGQPTKYGGLDKVLWRNDGGQINE